MSLAPWIIEQLEEERRRREEEASERTRIELPHTPDRGAAPTEEGERTKPTGSVWIVDISPASPNVVDV